jgi:hypothetical protein
MGIIEYPLLLDYTYRVANSSVILIFRQIFPSEKLAYIAK